MNENLEKLIVIVRQQINAKENEDKMYFKYCKNESDVLLSLGCEEWMDMLEEAEYSEYRRQAFEMSPIFIRLMDKIEDTMRDFLKTFVK